MLRALTKHWPEYLCEAAGLGLFMISACAFGVLLEAPDSPVQMAINSPLARRALMGLAMGATAIALIYSPIGKRSGAHFNPAVTLTFLRLGKLNPNDAVWYFIAQFAGGIVGVAMAALTVGQRLAEVKYVSTFPGEFGNSIAFIAELCLTFLLMSVVLRVSNHKRLNQYTGYFAGLLVASYITFEAPLSGMSLNPARTFGSAFSSHIWSALWIYFTAPPLGMLFAAQVYVHRFGLKRVFCAKFHHQNSHRCIFRCQYGQLEQRT